LSGHDSWEGVVDFSRLRLDFLKQYGDFKEGIPSADTIARVMGMMSTTALQNAFIKWMRDCIPLRMVRLLLLMAKLFEVL
jgi:predicted transposase YbfD/YdcC